MASDSVISSLGNAIAIQEGYGASAGNRPTRTNNPGDIGNTETGSHGFATPEEGYNALYGQVAAMFNNTSKIYNSNMTLAQVGSHYASDPNWAAGVAKSLGISVNTSLADIASGAVQIKPVAQPAGGSGSYSSPNDPIENYQTDNENVLPAVPVFGQDYTADQTKALTQAAYPALVIESGLYQEGWDEDPRILQVSNVTSAVNYPVTFGINFSTNGDILPITLKLLASMKNEQRSMRHLMNHQQTRTGVLINLWGSALDTIAGSCSTGLFANQFGISDFLSLSTATTEAKDMLVQAFSNESDVLESEGELDNGMLRMAAKDAFFEFLMMFKNNGVVWFQNPGYTGVTTSLDQSGPDAWSPVTGSSTFQNASRRNDVMTRGKVVMYYRNSAFSGYFKSLTLAMDAKNPFRWSFNFIFQVEASVTNVEVIP